MPSTLSEQREKSDSIIENPPPRNKKFQEKLERFDAAYQMLNGWQSIIFRLVVLVFVVGVEITFFIAVFNKIPIDGGVIAAMTIVAVLPILVMRAFDITALSLTKEGLTSSMSNIEQPETKPSSDFIPSTFKFVGEESGKSVIVQTDKFILVEIDGRQFKLALVE